MVVVLLLLELELELLEELVDGLVVLVVVRLELELDTATCSFATALTESPTRVNPPKPITPATAAIMIALGRANVFLPKATLVFIKIILCVYMTFMLLILTLMPTFVNP